MRLKMNYSKRCSQWRFPLRVSIDPNLSRSVTISLLECKDIFVGVYQASTQECSSLLQTCDVARSGKSPPQDLAEV